MIKSRQTVSVSAPSFIVSSPGYIVGVASASTGTGRVRHAVFHVSTFKHPSPIHSGPADRHSSPSPFVPTVALQRPCHTSETVLLDHIRRDTRGASWNDGLTCHRARRVRRLPWFFTSPPSTSEQLSLCASLRGQTAPRDHVQLCKTSQPSRSDMRYRDLLCNQDPN